MIKYQYLDDDNITTEIHNPNLKISQQSTKMKVYIDEDILLPKVTEESQIYSKRNSIIDKDIKDRIQTDLFNKD